jgi:hypothetical protein
MVLVVRPGYRIGSRTINMGSRVSNLIVSFGESSNLCILGIIFLFGFYTCEVLELVVISMTSPSSSKKILHQSLVVFLMIGGFTDSSFIERSNLSHLVLSSLVGL